MLTSIASVLSAMPKRTMRFQLMPRTLWRGQPSFATAHSVNDEGLGHPRLTASLRSRSAALEPRQHILKA